MRSTNVQHTVTLPCMCSACGRESEKHFSRFRLVSLWMWKRPRPVCSWFGHLLWEEVWSIKNNKQSLLRDLGSRVYILSALNLHQRLLTVFTALWNTSFRLVGRDTSWFVMAQYPLKLKTRCLLNHSMSVCKRQKERERPEGCRRFIFWSCTQSQHWENNILTTHMVTATLLNFV